MRAKPLPPSEQCYMYGADARNGAYLYPRKKGNLRVIVSDDTGWEAAGYSLPAWEHVSVSLEHRLPTYTEMCWVKNLFWRDDECVVQFHVPKDDHVNYHENCLHLFRVVGVEFPRPPASTVGPKGAKL